MNDTRNTTIFQEIEQDLQRQRFESLWKKYGPALIGCALLIVVATAAVMGWKSYRAGQGHAQTGDLAQLVLISDKGDPGQMIQSLLAYDKTHDGSAQAAIALLYAGQEAVQLDQQAQALEIYDALSKKTDVPSVYSQLGALLYVLTAMDEGQPAQLETRLQPLLHDEVIWRFMAAELAGHLAYKSGDLPKAQKLFADLINKEGVPPTIQQRASDMLLLVSGDKKQGKK